MNRIEGRRAMVELRMVRDGEGFNRSALARELGVSRKTVTRDVAAVRARWAAMSEAKGEDLLAEQTRTAAFFEAVAMRAMAWFVRLEGEDGSRNATVGFLNTAVGAMEKRARLMGLDEVKLEEVGPKEVTLRILPPKGYPDIRPPLPDRYRQQEEDAARLAAGEDVLADHA